MIEYEKLGTGHPFVGNALHMQIKGKEKIKPTPHTSSRFYFQFVKAIILKMSISWDLTIVGLIVLGKGSYT